MPKSKIKSLAEDYASTEMYSPGAACAKIFAIVRNQDTCHIRMTHDMYAIVLPVSANKLIAYDAEIPITQFKTYFSDYMSVVRLGYVLKIVHSSAKTASYVYCPMRPPAHFRPFVNPRTIGEIDKETAW